MNKINAYIGDRLRLRRQQLGLSQGDLASMMDISGQQIHKYETGLNKISVEMIFLMSKFLSVPIMYFYDGITLDDNENYITNNNNLCCERLLPLNILLIEDNPVDEMLVTKTLTKCKYETNIHTIHDGVMAIKFLRGNKTIEPFSIPDIILLDLNIPKRNGLEILKEIKSDRGISHIPVIILTNSINPEDMYRSYKNGAGGFMKKSFDINSFDQNLMVMIEYWSKVMILPSMQKQNQAACL